jgi:hypothetical protein
MKKAAIAICLTLFSIQSFSQESVRPKGMSFGLIASPDYLLYVSNLAPSYRRAFSFSGGLAASYQLSPRWAFSVALEYSQVSWRYDYLTPDFSQPNGIVSERISGSSSSVILPLKMDLYLCQGKTAVYLTGGFAASYYTFSRFQHKYTYWDGHTNTETRLYSNKEIWGSPSITPQLQFGLGIDHSFLKSRLRIEPIVRIDSYAFDNMNPKYLSYTAALNITWFLHPKKKVG